MADLVIYDLDGTLIDSAFMVSSILNEMRVEAGKNMLTPDTLIPWLSLGGEDLIVNSLDVKGGDIKRSLDIFRDRYFSAFTPIDSLYRGVNETLDGLLEMNINLAICTNKPRKLAEKVLKETEIFQKFSFVSAGDDLATKKPHPRNLEICLEFFSTSPIDSILVGDSSVDLLTARSTGVRFIHYVPGYDDGVIGVSGLDKIHNHKELLKLVRN